MNDAEPLYVRIQTEIKQAIREGKLAPGSALPSDKELEATYGVSRITVRRALDELKREGLLVRGQGRQSRVANPLVSTMRTEIDDDLAKILNLVQGTTAQVLRTNWQLAEEPMRSMLEVVGDEPLLRVDRLRFKGGRPIIHTCAHVPAWIGVKFDREALNKRTMLDLLMESGIQISSAVQTLRAAPCSESIARLIELAPEDPVFIIERLIRDDKSRPIQHLVATIRWDCYQYQISSGRFEK